MLIVWNKYYEGIRLYDKAKYLILDEIWSDSGMGEWSEV